MMISNTVQMDEQPMLEQMSNVVIIVVNQRKPIAN